MTAIANTAPAQSAPTRTADPRRFNRRALALIAPVAPALVAVLRLVMPYDTADSTRRALAKVAAHPDRQTAVIALGTFAVLLVIPGYLAVARLARRFAPVTTSIAIALSVAGYVGLALTLLTDQLLLSAGNVGLTQPASIHFLNNVNSGLTASVGGVVFVLGHVLGTVILGVALLRSRAVPRWAGWSVLVSQPIHVVAAVIVTNHPLDFVGFGLLAAGFTAASVRIWTMRDDDWDSAPART